MVPFKKHVSKTYTKHSYIFVLLFIVSCSTQKATTPSQKTLITIERIAALPAVISESSGLITSDGYLYTHNDSGSAASLYKLDTLGNLLATTTFKNIKNTDWEAITATSNTIYMADVGNNLGNRADLKIYSIPKHALQNTGVIPASIAIRYAAQTDFTPANLNHSFDAEALLAIDNYLYLFSKDWKQFTTTVYSINTSISNNLQPLQTLPVKGLITDATYNGKSRVVLTGYDKTLQPFIIIAIYIHGTFKLLDKIQLPLESTQIEAITYYGQDTNGNEIYYLTSERLQLTIGTETAQKEPELFKMILEMQ